MSVIVAGLSLYPTFRDVPRTALDASAPLWTSRSLSPGEVLWRQGESSDGLAILLRGEVTIRLDEIDLGVIGHGGMVGEVSAFLEGKSRSATVTAVGAVDLALMTLEGLTSLRAAESPLYDALLAQALRAASRRLRANNVRIAALASGSATVPSRDPPSTLTRMWRRFVPGLPRGECPPITPFLRSQPGLGLVPDATLERLAEAFTAEAHPEGHVLCLESEVADCAWLIAQGKVDVLSTVDGDRAERLASLGPGDLFGASALVEKTQRTASCVTVAPTWAWRASAADLARLTGDAAVAWKEMTLGAITSQVRLAHAVLGRVGTAAKGTATAGALDPVLAARGYLEGLPLEALRGSFPPGR